MIINSIGRFKYFTGKLFPNNVITYDVRLKYLLNVDEHFISQFGIPK